MGMQTALNRLANPILSALLRSPFHGLVDGNLMLISVLGRRSGQAYTTPVNYVREGDHLTVISLRERTWWRNVRRGAPVTLHLQGRPRGGYATVAEDETTVAQLLGGILALQPRYARFLRVALQPDATPEPGDLARAARSRVVVSIDLQ